MARFWKRWGILLSCWLTKGKGSIYGGFSYEDMRGIWGSEKIKVEKGTEDRRHAVDVRTEDMMLV